MADGKLTKVGQAQAKIAEELKTATGDAKVLLTEASGKLQEIYGRGETLVVKDGHIDLTGLKDLLHQGAGKARDLYHTSEPKVEKAAKENGASLQDHEIGF